MNQYFFITLIVLVVFQGSFSLCAMGAPSENQMVPMDQCVSNAFASLTAAENSQRQYLADSSVTTYGSEEIKICCDNLMPILTRINEEINRVYAPAQLDTSAKVNDRKEVRYMKAFIELFIGRLKEINKQLVFIEPQNGDDEELLRACNETIVADLRCNLLDAKADFSKFFKVLAGEPCEIGQVEANDMLLLMQHLAQKIDFQPARNLVKWLNIFCNDCNFFLKKPDEQPVLLPECLRIPIDQLGRENAAADAGKFPFSEMISAVKSGERKRLFSAGAEVQADLIIGSGGPKRILHALRDSKKARQSPEKEILKKYASKIVISAIKSIGCSIRNIVKTGIARCARLITFWRRREPADILSRETSRNHICSEMLKGFPASHSPQPTVHSSRWWHSFKFWRTS